MISRQEHSGEIRGVVIPAIGINLLLPNAAIAEVAGFQEPPETAASSPWLLGEVEWRGCTIPVVAMGSGENPARAALAFSRLKLIVCYAPDGNQAVPYLGLCATGMPHLARFHAEDLLPPVIEMQTPFAAQHLIYEDAPACIPDLDAVAKAVQDLLPDA